MINFEGFNPENTNVEFSRIPSNGYICKILKAEVETSQWGDRLKLVFDIAEGEYKGYYRKDWDNAQPDRQKWRGILRINIPTPSNQYFETQKNIFNGFAWNVEQSNPGYKFTGGEKTLEGKLIGIIIRDKQYRMEDGAEGFWSEPYSTRTVDCIREGKFKIPQPKMLPVQTANLNPATFTVVSDEELPF